MRNTVLNGKSLHCVLYLIQTISKLTYRWVLSLSMIGFYSVITCEVSDFNNDIQPGYTAAILYLTTGQDGQNLQKIKVRGV